MDLDTCDHGDDCFCVVVSPDAEDDEWSRETSPHVPGMSPLGTPILDESDWWERCLDMGGEMTFPDDLEYDEWSWNEWEGCEYGGES